MDWDVAIIGGGPAGLMAATHAARRGLRALLLEKKPRCGSKLLVSGGTRCNVTHDAEPRGIIEAFGRQGRFLHSALAALGPRDVVEILHQEGVECKTEPGGKVFPQSDRASDVLDVLLRRLQVTACRLSMEEAVIQIEPIEGGFRVVTERMSHRARNVILATGGKSYPATGSTGDGFEWAARLGHTIVPPRPALTPIVSHVAWVTDLRGVTLPDVAARVIDPGGGEKPVVLGQTRGALLFAHFGVTGPVALDLSRHVSRHSNPTQLLFQCDFLPEIPQDALAASLQKSLRGRRLVVAALGEWLPRGLAEAVARRADVPLDRRVADFTKTERTGVVKALKQCDIPVAGVMGFRKAEVTSGGVALEEVDSRTMQSLSVPGLYFAGEVLDLDGPIGGYNFQAAFSTGWLAGGKVS